VSEDYHNSQTRTRRRYFHSRPTTVLSFIGLRKRLRSTSPVLRLNGIIRQ